MSRRVIMAGLLMGLSACAGSPAPQVGHLPDGRYLPTAQEQALDCPRLTYSVTSGIAKLKGLADAAAKQSEAPPPTLLSMFGRMFGKQGSGVTAVEESERERARIEALNGLLASKGCTPVELEAKVRELDAAAARAPGGKGG